MPAAKPRRHEADQSDCATDPHASDEFRMYEFKVRRCVRGRSHDWTDCPFAHPGEKARRRDPRRHSYSADPCPDFRRGGACPRGDACALSHGVFECWLHPARYRTQPCRDGRDCRRKVCFFAHSPRQLRILASSQMACSFPAASSPTSTLIGLSHFSPPLTPSSPGVDYKALFAELVCSMEAMDLYSASPGSSKQTLISGNQLTLAPPSYSGVVKGKGLKEERGGDRESLRGSNGCPDLDWVEALLM